MYTATIITDTMNQSNGYIIAHDSSLEFVCLETQAYIAQCVKLGWLLTQTDYEQWFLTAYGRTVEIVIQHLRICV